MEKNMEYILTALKIFYLNNKSCAKMVPTYNKLKI